MNHRECWQPCWPYTPARETRGQPSIAPTMPTNTAQSDPAEPLKTADLPLHYAENGASWQRAPASRPAHPPPNFNNQADRSRTPSPIHTDAPRPAPGMPLPIRSRGRSRETERPQRFPQRDHPINILSPTPEPTRGSRIEVSMGARAQTIRPTQRSHAPPETMT